MLTDKNKIFVFLGSSLAHDEARKILPHASFLPPIKCGDITHIIKLKPQIICIIDGSFDFTAAVWHKEILHAIACGITVIGAASMGALRAAELDSLGMLGIGEIYTNYARDIYQDDDEVAVMHKPGKSGFTAISDAMVNIRATINAAITQQIIPQSVGQLIIEEAKNTFYQKRDIKKICQKLIETNAENGVLETFINWLTQGGYVDQKQDDAKKCLEFVKENFVNNNLNTQKQSHKHNIHSLFFRTLLYRACFAAFPYYGSQLPMTTQVSCVSRLLGDKYRALQRLAYLMCAIYSMALSDEYSDIKNMKFANANQLTEKINASENIEQSTAAPKETCHLIHVYIEKQSSSIVDYAEKVNDLMHILLVINGDYQKMKSLIESNTNMPVSTEMILAKYEQEQTVKFNILLLSARIWIIIQEKAQALSIQENDTQWNFYSEHFKKRRQLNSESEFNDWMNINDLNIIKYQSLIKYLTLYDHLIYRNNIELICKCFANTEIDWLLMALNFCGIYNKIENMILNNVNFLDMGESVLNLDSQEKDSSKIQFTKNDIDNFMNEIYFL